MMRWTILGCVAALCSAGAAASAASGPGAAAVAVDRQIVLIEGGCGPYGFRDYYGYCRPRRVYAPPPPRRFYGCPYGFRPTPFGCRPFY